MTKPTKWHARPAKTQISLGIRPVWSESTAVRMKKAWVLSYPLSAQRTLWSYWADAQAESSLGAQSFCWFGRLKYLNPALTHKDALVLEGRQEGEGITTISVRGSVLARFVHFNRKQLFFTSPDFLPVLIPGTYFWTQRATQLGLHDASLHDHEAAHILFSQINHYVHSLQVCT